MLVHLTNLNDYLDTQLPPIEVQDEQSAEEEVKFDENGNQSLRIEEEQAAINDRPVQRRRIRIKYLHHDKENRVPSGSQLNRTVYKNPNSQFRLFRELRLS